MCVCVPPPHVRRGHLALQIGRIRLDEAARMQRWDIALQSEKNRAHYRWMTLYRFLVGHRGVLDDGKPRVSKSTKHWKLDRSETFRRMRLKLAPNLHFNDHSDARWFYCVGLLAALASFISSI